ncbi:deoxynucleoside kinase [Acidithiobacillus sp.]|uniref:deoxynucleoside kinase n=1 Tax=Acidithiobacillus sp. TaxID=1872118 RepID=UPI00261728B7|nr:deoxynucleoside kinase [Acidithiobacillus sp.]
MQRLFCPGMTNPRIISIEGPMGAGKTSLARQLGHALGGQIILEAPAQNPFLCRFYQGPGAALATELQFLMQRRAQWQHPGDKHWIISDHSARKDEIFTPLTLDTEELRLFQALRMALDYHPAPADLMIFLDAPLPILLERIRVRGDAYEQALTADYLERVQAAYRAWRANYSWPCLDIDSAQVDFVHDPRHTEQLIDTVRYRLKKAEERDA